MSKPVKNMMMEAYRSRLAGHDEALLISLSGVNAQDTHRIRAVLGERSARVTVVKNAVARRALEGTALEPLGRVLVGPSALVYGSAPVVELAREMVRLLEQFPALALKGAILEGELYEGEAGVRQLSMLPTREEAIGKLVTAAVGPGRKLAGQLLGPGARLAGVVAAIRERLEKGEAISAGVGQA